MQRSNRHVDSLQGFMNSFKQFEKKLDKLQTDVSLHGNTLSELRVLVAKLANPSGANKLEDVKNDHKKTIGSQYDKSMPMRHPEAIRPLPNKLVAKSFQGQKRSFVTPPQQSFLQAKKASLPAVTNKHHPRPKKAEAPRKATTLHPQKTSVQKKRLKTANKI